MTHSWGNLYRPRHREVSLSWLSDAGPTSDESLAVGNKRSYGDVCVNDGGSVIGTTGLNRFISFDKAKGVLRCEAGVTLWQIAKLVVPFGWFLPVTPGTGFVTLAGAVANDVHGKNHHVSGSFGCFVREFELVRSNGERLVCNQSENVEFFAATIGGLGLTGLITWVEITLKPITHTLIDVESIAYESYSDFRRLSDESEKTHEYCVSWIDCLTESGSGVFFRGNHSRKGELNTSLDSPNRNVPAILGAGFPLVNRMSLAMFNFMYKKNHSGVRQYTQTIGKFFYPLDSLLNWNRIYGRKGFYQFQCVVPFESTDVLQEALSRIAAGKQGSFLSVLKTMGDIRSPGLLSFSRPGVTLALDFPNQGARTRQLLSALEHQVIEAGGAIYPAKDANMSADYFRRSFPGLDEFRQYKDPGFTSSFWKRVQSV